jgi:hypothetical protein
LSDHVGSEKVPEVDSLSELNLLVEQWDEQDGARRIRMRPRTVGAYFAVEQPILKPLPDESFDTSRTFALRVDRHSRISVRTHCYSVPVRHIGRRVRAVRHTNELVVYDEATEIARHERLIAKDGERLVLDHYLEALVRKPGALPGATALEQAKAAGKFTPVHDAWWAAACKARGDRDGIRALIDVLLLGRRIPHEHLVADSPPPCGWARSPRTPSPWRPARLRRPMIPTWHLWSRNRSGGKNRR